MQSHLSDNCRERRVNLYKVIRPHFIIILYGRTSIIYNHLLVILNGVSIKFMLNQCLLFIKTSFIESFHVIQMTGQQFEVCWKLQSIWTRNYGAKTLPTGFSSHLSILWDYIWRNLRFHQSLIFSGIVYHIELNRKEFIQALCYPSMNFKNSVWRSWHRVRFRWESNTWHR
jgi:hypothetical protein